MKFQKQLIEHNVTKGDIGDCFRTCVAVILEMNAEDVPHFYESSYSDTPEDKWDMDKAVDEWLANWLLAQGYHRIKVLYGNVPTLEEMLDYCTKMSDLPYLLSGTTQSGNAHVVICKGDQIIWDTSSKDVGLVGPMEGDVWMIEWLVKQ